jgi:MscS family membrane protein
LRLRGALQVYQQEGGFKNSNYVRAIGEQLSSLIQMKEEDSSRNRYLALKTAGYLLDIDGNVPLSNLEDVSSSKTQSGETTESYRISGTPLHIVLVKEGTRAGEYLFSTRTVDVAPVFYQRLVSGAQADSLDPLGWSVSMLQFTGPLVPATFLKSLPDGVKTTVLDTPIWKIFLTAIVYVLFVIAILLSIKFDFRRNIFRSISVGYLVFIVLFIVINRLIYQFLDQGIILNGRFSFIVFVLDRVLLYIFIAWLFWHFITSIFDWTLVDPRFPGDSLDSNMMKLLGRVVAAIGCIVIITYGLDSMGVPIMSTLAGLGIGGIAVALAIRPTLENLLGGLILYIDRPVRIGDFCEFGTRLGTVEAIGVRSIQIRSLDRTLVSIPNAQFADMQIVNWARCDKMLISETIGLRYETETDQLRFVMASIREMLHAHPKIDSETVRVRYDKPGESSLDVSVRVYVDTREWNDYFAVKEDVFLRINNIVQEAGSGFAFPSSTVYITKDNGIDTDLGSQAEETVQSWRGSRELPFPEFSETALRKMEGKVSYPPRGSPDFRSGDERPLSADEPLSLEQDDEEQNEPKG